MKSKLLILVVFTVFTQIANAQKFGVKGGLNLVSMSYSMEELDNSPGPIIGLHFGPIVEFKLTNRLNFNSGILYTLKGGNLEIWRINNDLEFVPERVPIRLNFLEMPLNIAYIFSLRETSNFFVQAGPYVGYAINGKFKLNSETIDIQFGGLGNMKRFDFGLGIGSGFQFGSWVTSLSYQFGLANRYDTPGSRTRNNALQLSIAYMFGN